MSLKKWAAERHLRPHKTSQKEIKNLLDIVSRDTEDSAIAAVSADARFVMAYNAALKLCTILLYASGYRTDGTGAHYYTIEAMAEILGKDARANADYLDTCRTQRNHAEYDFVDVASDTDVEELYQFVVEFKKSVLKWLKINHSDLLP